VHLAAQELLNGGCDVAIAGGVHLILTPDNVEARCKLGVVSKQNRHFAFDARADGFVQGEGCGVVALRRLSDALADGDRVYAIVESSSVNNNGGGNGLQAPNGEAQGRLITHCIKKAGCKPSDVAYVETHGTGTELGDPVEIEGLSATYCEDRDPAKPLLIGSIKSNFGHLEPAAGVISLIKGCLVTNHAEVPPQANFETPNPHIPWSRVPIQVATTGRMLNVNAQGDVRVGVSSFGINGTNAHVILKRPRDAERVPFSTELGYSLPISAKSEAALETLKHSVGEAIRTNPDRLEDISFTLSTGRTQFPHRMLVHAKSASDALDALNGCGPHKTGRRPKVAFVFAGQGSQVPGGGRQHYENDPTFRKVIDICAGIWSEYRTDVPFIDLMFGDDPDVVNKTENAQPLIYAFAWAAAETIQAAGVQPDVLIGHSVGEFVAAALSGVWSLEEGFRLIIQRGLLMEQMQSDTGMMAIKSPAQYIRPIIAECELPVDVSVINTAKEVIVGGRNTDLARLSDVLEGSGILSARLGVSHAFHSRVVDPILPRWRALLDGLHFGAKRIPIVSNLSARVHDDDHVDAEYWTAHMRRPVLFSESLDAVADMAGDLWIGIGAAPILAQYMARHAVEAVQFSDDAASLSRLGEAAFMAGVQVDWRHVIHPSQRASKISVPGHPRKNREYQFRVISH